MSANIKINNKTSPDEKNIFRDWHEKQKKIKKSFFNKKKHVMLQKRFLLIGAPNVGKSTFFNKITTSTAMVSNIDRMTNDVMAGKFKNSPSNCLIDLPGIYNLSHPIDEEIVVAHELFHEQFNKIINIISASSIRRDLLLTIQLIESGRLSTLGINMIDETPNAIFNLKKIKKYLNGVDVVLTQANRNKGINKIEKSVLRDKTANSLLKIYPDNIEKIINEISIHIPNRTISQRYYALMFLESNQFVCSAFQKHYPNAFNEIMKILKNKNLDYLSQQIIESRNKYIETVIEDCIENKKNENIESKPKFYKVDRYFLKKWIGIPGFVLLMFLIYYLSFGPYTGGYLQDRLDYVFSDLFIKNVLDNKVFVNTSGVGWWFAHAFCDGLLIGFFTILTFLPVLIILFLCSNLMQQVGILSRVSVLLDQMLERFGVSGRSVVTLLTGFGCTVPAIMLARNSNSKRERLISILITPLTICSARAIVLSFVSNAIFGSQWGWICLMAFISLSGFICLMFGLLLTKTMFRKQKSFFIVEMVKWRTPDIMVISKLIWLQIKEFWKSAALFIALASLIIWFFLHINLNQQFIIANDNNIDKSLLSDISRGVNYILYPAGFYANSDSWKLTASLISAFPAKEIALTNLNLLFPNDSVNHFFSNIYNIPLGLSYLTIIMFYVPCSATVATMHKETNWKLTFTHIGSSLLISYILAIIVYWFSYLILIV